jgi:hypothetical protein
MSGKNHRWRDRFSEKISTTPKIHGAKCNDNFCLFPGQEMSVAPAHCKFSGFGSFSTPASLLEGHPVLLLCRPLKRETCQLDSAAADT